jgi:hypothetical protein
MTDPVNEIIPRAIPDNIQPIIEFFTETLNELVNFGSHIMKWDLEPPVKDEDAVAPIMMFRHYLDVIDSISLLIKQGSGDTAKILLRAGFETSLGMEYLLEKDSINKAMAFLVSDILIQIKTLKKLNPITKEGAELEQLLQSENNIKGLDLSAKYDLNQALANKESLLNKPSYQVAYQEYLKLKAKKISNPAWYHYFGGPSNIYGLAKHLNQVALYELLYRQWSGTVHGSQVYLGKLTSGPQKGMVEIVQLRYFKDVQEVATYAQLFSLKLFRQYVSKRLPEKEKELNKWYVENRGRFQMMTDKSYIKVI